ncbi:MAG: T9SS type A sorting domain-containing protein [Segetibacter sp.]
MKPIFFISLSALLFISKVISQGACSNIKIESSVVAKPTEASIASATCSALVVQWKGSMDQTYLISSIYKDLTTNEQKETEPATNISCDNNGNCTATIPVKAGTTVSWSVQAHSLINNRTFSSYPLQGEQDYAIPNCIVNPGVVNADKTIPPAEIDKMKVEVYPNPVHSTLNINLTRITAPTEGKAVIRIFDVNGRGVLVKQATLGNVQINVSSLRNGAYFITVQDNSGKVVHKGKFIKE